MNHLKEARRAKGLTQVEVAKYIGITQGGYSGWERGDVNIDGVSLARLAELFDVTTDYLIGKTDAISGKPIKYLFLDLSLLAFPLRQLKTSLIGKNYRRVWLPAIRSILHLK